MMQRQPLSYQWYKALRKYRNLQSRLSQAELPDLIKRLSLKLNRLERRIFRLNRRFKIGVAAVALTAWLAGPVQAQNFPATFTPASLNGTNGFTVNGASADSYAGISVHSAGDVNGDGIEDMIIGASEAPVAGRDNPGEAYVVFGNTNGFGNSFGLSSLNGTNGFSLSGETDKAETGRSVSAAGDINNDGIDDLLIGAPNALNGAGDSTGAAYVVFGQNGGFGANIDLASLNGTNGFKMSGVTAGDFTGFSVGGGGDINGDGIDDIIIGTRYGDVGPLGDAGEAYVVFGKMAAFGANMDLSSLNGSNGFRIQGAADYSYTGSSVDFAGDFNGDGMDDVIVGAPGVIVNNKYDVGAAYVIFGKNTAFGGTMDVASLNGTNGVAINAFQEDSYAGLAVAGAGDVNGDGIDDVIIGAPFADPHGGSYDGEAYIVFGKTTGFGASMSLSTINGTNGFVVHGNMGDYGSFGLAVGSAGDINVDGFDDIVIGGMYTAVSGNSYAGEAHVIMGGSNISSPVSLGNLNGMNGFALEGAATSDYAGASVTSGDFNGDGVSDLIVGAGGIDLMPNANEGGAYVIYGRDVNASLADKFDPLPMSLTPNPTTGIIELHSSAFGSAHQPLFSLFDASGRNLNIPSIQQSQDRFRIDLGNLPTGIYHLQVITDGKMALQKILKK